MGFREITVKNLFTDQWIAAGTTVTSDPCDIGGLAANGYVSLQIYVEGSGTSICAGYLLSNDGMNYVRASGGTTIKAGTNAFHHACGTARNGRDIVSFTPTMAARMKIELWESVGSTGSTVTAKLAIH